MSTETQARVDSARERIATLKTRAKTKAVDGFHTEEAEWDAAYLELERELAELADDIEAAQAELIADASDDAKAVAAKVDGTLDAIDERLLEIDEAISAKADEHDARVQGTLDSVRSTVNDAQQDFANNDVVV